MLRRPRRKQAITSITKVGPVQVFVVGQHYDPTDPGSGVVIAIIYIRSRRRRGYVVQIAGRRPVFFRTELVLPKSVRRGWVVS